MTFPIEVVLEANIAGGKTTCLESLERDGFHVVYEAIEDWTPLLNLFYQDKKRWAFALQMKILNHFENHRKKSVPETSLVRVWERSPISTKYIFADMLKAADQFDDAEYNLYLDYWRQSELKVDMCIYIRTDPDIVIERLRERNGDEDRNIDNAYLRAVHDRHEAVFGKSNKVIIVDGNQSPEKVSRDIAVIIQSAIKEASTSDLLQLNC